MTVFQSHSVHFADTTLRAKHCWNLLCIKPKCGVWTVRSFLLTVGFELFECIMKWNAPARKWNAPTNRNGNVRLTLTDMHDWFGFIFFLSKFSIPCMVNWLHRWLEYLFWVSSHTAYAVRWRAPETHFFMVISRLTGRDLWSISQVAHSRCIARSPKKLLFKSPIPATMPFH